MAENLLKEEISKLRGLIKTNSKDAKYADTLTKRLIDTAKADAFISLTGRDFGKEIERVDKGSYCIIQTTNGFIYKTYGGYQIFITPNNKCLYDTLEDMMQYLKSDNSEDDKDKQILDIVYYDINNILRLPLIAFSDTDLFSSISLKIREFLLKMHNESEVLKEETKEDIEANKAFEGAILSVDEIADNEESNKEEKIEKEE